MAEKEDTTEHPQEPEQHIPFTVAPSLRKILDKLPTAEAIEVVEELARLHRSDNNNNNNNKMSPLENRLLERLAALPAARLAEILEAETKA